MKGGTKPQGYTITETLIFLAISSALFVSAVAVFSGQQGKVEFYQSVREFNSKLEDIMNDVSNGYYNYPTASYSCTQRINDASMPPPDISPIGGGSQGTNGGCIFLGTALQFSPDGDKSKFYTYTIVGRRLTNDGKQNVSSIAEAKPILVAQGSTAGVDRKEVYTMDYGLYVSKMTYEYDSTVSNTNSFAVMSDLTPSSEFPDVLASESRDVDIFSFSGLTLGFGSKPTVDSINNAFINNPGARVRNPAGGIKLCVVGGINQHAIITIGSNSRKTSTTINYGAGSVCP